MGAERVPGDDESSEGLPTPKIDARPDPRKASPLAIYVGEAGAEPNRTDVMHVWQGQLCTTAVGRHWDERARRTCNVGCDEGECTFDDGFCLIGVRRYVPNELCALLAKRAGD